MNAQTTFTESCLALRNRQKYAWAYGPHYIQPKERAAYDSLLYSMLFQVAPIGNGKRVLFSAIAVLCDSDAYALVQHLSVDPMPAAFKAACAYVLARYVVLFDRAFLNDTMYRSTLAWWNKFNLC